MRTSCCRGNSKGRRPLVSSVGQRYQSVRKQIDDCCAANHRNPDDVALLSVSKTVGVDEVGQAIEAGAVRFGENRPDQIVMKQAAYPDVEWHFIGNIQSRRIDDIVSAATLIHSVCKVEHFAKIDAAAKRHGKIQGILLEVNVSGEESKSGFTPDQASEALLAADAFDNIEVLGLMTMAPRGDGQVAEATFAGLRELRDALRQVALPRHGALELHELSMGMSEDWQEAIAEGATMVRIGRAVFSEDF